jgi:hypothetical protein
MVGNSAGFNFGVLCGTKISYFWFLEQKTDLQIRSAEDCYFENKN